MIFGSIELPLPFDILDALVMECLPGYAPGWVEFTREQITPATVVYSLRQDQLGDLGQITLRKVSKRSSEMSIVRPRRPTSRDRTPEELEAIAAIREREERLRAHAALSKKIWAESDERHGRQEEHQQKVIQAMFSRFEYDLAWKSAMEERLEARPEEVVEEARERLEEEMTRLLPRDFPKKAETIAKYKEAFSIIQAMQEEYREEYNLGYTKDPKPELEDYREALASRMGWKRTHRTIRKVIEFGRKGWLQ